MGEIGAGLGSSYPTTLDTDASVEANDGEASPTLARAEVPNDLADAIIKVETELGVLPKGNHATVKARITTQTNRIILFPASCFETRSGTAGWAGFTQTQGTNIDYAQLDFDKDTDEKAFTPPFKIDNWDGEALTITIVWKSAETTGNVMWGASFYGCIEGEAFDGAVTSHAFVADAVQGVAGKITVSTLSVDPTELANNDYCYMNIYRDANHASDTLDGDVSVVMAMIEFTQY